MRIEGTEEELRKLFKKKDKKHKKLSPNQKKIAITLLIFLVAIVVGAYLFQLTGYISPKECEIKVNQAVLQSQAEGFWQSLIAKNAYILQILLLAMGAGWVLHGVGFKIF